MKWLQIYGFPEDIRLEALRQIRILWAYESTGIEGNTLDFGDTKLVMEEGITIGGKTLREHNEVVGHGRVTDRLETLGQRPLETADVLALHQDRCVRARTSTQASYQSIHDDLNNPA